MHGLGVPVIILADANATRRSALRQLLNSRATLLDCETASEVVALSRTVHPHAIILGPLADCCSSPLEPVLQLRPESRLNVVFITDQSSEQLAIAAIDAGIRYYFKSPVCLEDVARIVTGLLPEQHAGDDFEGLVGESTGMLTVKRLIRCFGKTKATVLITGETGTGKELVASSIHRHSLWASAPMVTVNCAAIPDTLVESELFGFEKGAFTGAGAPQKGKIAHADGGTLFLDEIGDMSRLTQAKILRALESGEIQSLGARKPVSVDVRVIAATHQDLEALMEEDEFRPDLFYRLNVARIHVPALRERLDDLPRLVEYILNQFNKKWERSITGVTPGALELLYAHDWPGNVRELRNLLESAFWMSSSGRIESSDLAQLRRGYSSPMSMTPKSKSQTLSLRRTSSERDDLMRVLEATNWNKTQTAEVLKWSRMTVYRKIDQYGLSSDCVHSPGAKA
jgi:DNA-binding NtrC family response regulator